VSWISAIEGRVSWISGHNSGISVRISGISRIFRPDFRDFKNLKYFNGLGPISRNSDQVSWISAI